MQIEFEKRHYRSRHETAPLAYKCKDWIKSVFFSTLFMYSHLYTIDFVTVAVSYPNLSMLSHFSRVLDISV